MRPARILSAAAVALVLIAPGIAHADSIDVTGNPLVQQDLIAAQAYWQTPPPCPMTVVVTPMASAIGNDDRIIPAA